MMGVPATTPPDVLRGRAGSSGHMERAGKHPPCIEEVLFNMHDNGYDAVFYL